jgi:hypothetical protein
MDLKTPNRRFESNSKSTGDHWALTMTQGPWIAGIVSTDVPDKIAGILTPGISHDKEENNTTRYHQVINRKKKT